MSPSRRPWRHYSIISNGFNYNGKPENHWLSAEARVYGTVALLNLSAIKVCSIVGNDPRQLRLNPEFCWQISALNLEFNYVDPHKTAW